MEQSHGLYQRISSLNCSPLALGKLQMDLSKKSLLTCSNILDVSHS